MLEHVKPNTVTFTILCDTPKTFHGWTFVNDKGTSSSEHFDKCEWNLELDERYVRSVHALCWTSLTWTRQTQWSKEASTAAAQPLMKKQLDTDSHRVHGSSAGLCRFSDEMTLQHSRRKQ